jgi:hypothetical protein
MAKGRKTGGRQKGTANKVTSAAREAFLATFGKLEGELEGWIRKTAEGIEVPIFTKDRQPVLLDGKQVLVREGADPGKAADLLIRMAEYHFPKLGRQELVGEDGGPVEFVIRDLSREDE